MRPQVLEDGYGVGARLLFRMVRVTTGRSLPDAARLTFYRPDFYGTHSKALTHEVMRGPSPWSVGDRELMAAYVAAREGSPFCVGAHSATAARALGDGDRVAAVLADLDSAPIDDGLRATLRMLGGLADERAVEAAGVSREAIEDALAVGFVFAVTARLANAFAFEVLSPEGFEAAAKYLLKRGYR